MRDERGPARLTDGEEAIVTYARVPPVTPPGAEPSSGPTLTGVEVPFGARGRRGAPDGYMPEDFGNRRRRRLLPRLAMVVGLAAILAGLGAIAAAYNMAVGFSVEPVTAETEATVQPDALDTSDARPTVATRAIRSVGHGTVVLRDRTPSAVESAKVAPEALPLDEVPSVATETAATQTSGEVPPLGEVPTTNEAPAVATETVAIAPADGESPPPMSVTPPTPRARPDGLATAAVPPEGQAAADESDMDALMSEIDAIIAEKRSEEDPAAAIAPLPPPASSTSPLGEPVPPLVPPADVPGDQGSVIGPPPSSEPLVVTPPAAVAEVPPALADAPPADVEQAPPRSRRWWLAQRLRIGKRLGW